MRPVLNLFLLMISLHPYGLLSKHSRLYGPASALCENTRLPSEPPDSLRSLEGSKIQEKNQTEKQGGEERR